MGFHFCAHSWEIRDMADGTLVKLSRRDMDGEKVAELFDDLLGLVLENGTPNLYLDFSNIGDLGSFVAAKLLDLQAKLAEHGGRLVVMEVQPIVFDLFKAARLADKLDIRQRAAAATVLR